MGTTEFKINTYSTGDQFESSVANLNNGGFVVTWTSKNFLPDDGQDGDRGGVYGQRYDRMGNKDGPEFQINTHSIDNQFFPSVVGLDNGGFVVTWSSGGSQDGDGSGIYGQRYDVSGNKSGYEFLINTYTASSQHASSVVNLSDGAFVAVWQSDGQDGDRGGVYGQRYDVSGSKSGSEFKINTYSTGDQFESSVANLNNGGFVVTWMSRGQVDGLDGIFGQQYNNTGKVGNEFQIDTYSTSSWGGTSVTGLTNGGFFVTWQSTTQDNENKDDIFGQLYNSSGVKVGSEIQINTFAYANELAVELMSGYQTNSSVTSLTGGGFVVTWMSNGQDVESRWCALPHC